MAVLNTVTFWHCATAEDWSTTVPGSKGGTYTVSWNKWGHQNHERVQYDYSCTCKAYKYGRGAYCKHIMAANIGHCNWLQFIDGGDAVEKDGEHHCPMCGAGVRSMGWGV